MYENLAILALFALVFSLVAGRFEKTVLSAPLLFVIFGFLAGPSVLGVLDLEVSNVELRVIADLTLALVLFIDAANADFSVLRHSYHIPGRMLLLGLPLTILFGFVVGAVLFEQITLIEAAILATMLAATDAALGKAVITNPEVPAELREGLNFESGLNDGLCVPVLFVFIALAVSQNADDVGLSMALGLVATEIGIGLAVAVVVTGVSIWILRLAESRGWITEIWGQMPVITLAIANFAVAQTLHGSGYIAAFVGGLLFGHFVKEHRHELVMAAEGIGETLALVTWITFGAVVVVYAWAALTWQVVVYALLSLTVVRMLPIYLSLAGSGQNRESKLFLGWFGPRGLASIVFAIIVVGQELPGGNTLTAVVACTVLFSVVAHGVSANPLVRALVRKEGERATD